MYFVCHGFMGVLLLKLNGKMTTHSSQNIKFRVMIWVRFKIRVRAKNRVRVRVIIRVRVRFLL